LGVTQLMFVDAGVKIDLDDLKHRLINVWAGIQQSLIDDAINQWHKCLPACVQARGEHFEHSLDSRINQTLRTLIYSINISF